MNPLLGIAIAVGVFHLLRKKPATSKNVGPETSLPEQFDPPSSPYMPQTRLMTPEEYKTIEEMWNSMKDRVYPKVL